MFKKYVYRLVVLVGLSLAMNSCVGDVDFDQADEIAIQNQFDIDLVYFTLSPENFVAPDGSVLMSSITESTGIDFIKEGFIQDDLTRIDFDFGILNGYSQNFNLTVRFLDEMNQETFAFTLPVLGSTDGAPKENFLEQRVVGTDLINLKASITMEVTFEIIENGQPINGSLKFLSKALYTFGS